MLSPEQILRIVQATDLPEGYGFACYDSPGEERHGKLVIGVLPGVLQVWLALERDGTEYQTIIAIDEETTLAEFATAIEVAVVRLRIAVERRQPWLQ